MWHGQAVLAFTERIKDDTACLRDMVSGIYVLSRRREEGVVW